MTNDKLIFRPRSKKLTERKESGYNSLRCYPSDEQRTNQIYIEIDDFFVIVLAYGKVINRAGLNIYEHYSFKKQDWLKLLNEARKIVCFSSFGDMYNYVHRLEIVNLGYSMEDNSKEIWNERKEIDSMLDDLFAWTEFVMKDGDKVEILGV